MESMTYLSIGDFARASGLTAKALRLYDELELVVPAKVDEFNGYRWYAPEQLERARLVASLRLIGMPLYRIREIGALPPAAAATEVLAYWRQVEADHRSRRGTVSTLVEQMRAKEPEMKSEQASWKLRSVVRREQGARQLQQDAVYAGYTAFGVADGFGTGVGAAPAAVGVLAALEERSDAAGAAAAVEDAVAQARAAVAAANGDGGDGSTLTAIWFIGGQAVTAHVGDCRLYRVRDGRVERLTQDHTLVAALVEEGRLTEDEAQAHPHRDLINRALAADAPAEPDIRTTDVRPGDRFALTSDGVHAVIAREELASLLTLEADLEAVASAMADAVAKAHAPDNYSLVLVEVSA